MSSAKHLPIQPYPTAIAPSGAAAHVGASAGPRKNASGLTIRTSRHWVLPPRPKPGRKPNHYDSKRGTKSASPPPTRKVASPVAAKKEAAKLPVRNLSVPTTYLKPTAAAAAAATQQQLQQPLQQAGKKQTKTALKKEIQHIRVENSKLKQELGQLVGNLQALKKQYTPPVVAEASTRKRHHLEDSTSAFLKFEDDDEECRTQEAVALPPLLVANAKMNLTSSMSSCRTIPTDDEDILTISSSTPNSLVSSDLQHSSSLSSASSLNLNANHVQHPPMHQSPNGNAQLKFLDDYEQMEFYDKYMRMDLNLPSQQHDDNYLVALDSIKEEETEFKFTETNSNNLLSFLENQNVKPDEKSDLFFPVKQEPNDDAKLYHEFNDESQPTTTTTTTTNSISTNFYMPPSLEELMDEQDGGLKNFSNVATTLTNNEINDYRDDFDMLRVEVFDMI